MWQTRLSHSWWVSSTPARTRCAKTETGESPHAGFRRGVKPWIADRSGPILTRLSAGSTGCSDTAFDTIRLTPGRSPATADITNDVEPWQCTTAFSDSAPVCSRT